MSRSRRTRLTVVTGVSGSGKSSLAFDTIFAEGQQRFADSFSTYARRFLQRASEAEFDEVSGLTPAIADQPARAVAKPAFDRRDTDRDSRLLPPAVRASGDAVLPALCAPTALCARLVDGTCRGLRVQGRAGADSLHVLPELGAGSVSGCHGLGFRLGVRSGQADHRSLAAAGGGAMSGHKAGRFYGDPARPAHGHPRRGRDRRWESTSPRRGRTSTSGTQALALYGAGDRVFDVEWNYLRGNAARGPSLPVALARAARIRPPGVRAQARRRARRGTRAVHDAVPCADCGGGKLKAEFLAVRFAGAEHPRTARRRPSGTAWPSAGVDCRGCARRRRSRVRHYRGPARGSRAPAHEPPRRRARLSDARSAGRIAVRRRGTARPPGIPAAIRPDRHHLRARRADHRPSSARHVSPDRLVARAA